MQTAMYTKRFNLLDRLSIKNAPLLIKSFNTKQRKSAVHVASHRDNLLHVVHFIYCVAMFTAEILFRSVDLSPRPRITDFNLVKSVDDRRRQTDRQALTI